MQDFFLSSILRFYRTFSGIASINKVESTKAKPKISIFINSVPSAAAATAVAATGSTLENRPAYTDPVYLTEVR